MSSITFSVLNLSPKPKLTFGNSIDSSSKKSKLPVLPTVKGEMRQTNILKRLCKMTFLALGLTTAACNPAKDVVLPQNNLVGVEKDAAPIFKMIMATATDRAIPSEAGIHDNGIATDTEYRFLNKSGDTLIYKMRKISLEGLVWDGKSKFFKDKDGLFVAEDYMYIDNKVDDSRLRLSDVNKYQKQADGSIASISPQGLKKEIYTLLDDKTVLKNDLISKTKVTIKSIFRKMK